MVGNCKFNFNKTQEKPYLEIQLMQLHAMHHKTLPG